MRRPILVVLASMLCLAGARGQTAAEKKATIAYLRALQTRGGGFLPMQPSPNSGRLVKPSLRATTAGLRALRYFGGKVPDAAAAARFVDSCFDRTRGGFVDSQPRLTPDAITTAVGLMAVVELKMPRNRYVPAAVKFLEASAKTFEETRMAAAAFETIGKRPAKATAWIEEVTREIKRDGTYGQGTGQARGTASRVVTVLRLGGKVKERDQVVKALRDGQRKDGGFGKAAADGSDLETCYRVVRAFVMLKEEPADVAGLRKFVARCRNGDGGYGIAPGQQSQAGSTYFAAIILHWLGEKGG